MSDEILVPDLQLKLKGAPMPVVRSLHADLASVSVHQQQGLTTEFTLRLYTWDTQKIRYGWVDDSTLRLGREIEIWLGYVNKLERLLVGEITDLELTFSNDEPPMLTVTGQSKAHRLARTERTVPYVGKTDTEIAQTIAQRNRLRFEGDLTSIVHPYILQANMTDLAFLNERARLAGAVVDYDEGLLRFKLQNQPAPSPLKLKAGLDLLTFTPRITSRGRVGSVKAVSVDASGNPLSHQARLKANRPGNIRLDEAYGDQSAVIQAREARTEAEIRAVVTRELQRLQTSFVTASGTCLGMSGLKPGLIVDVHNVGKRFGGKYRVTSVTHSFSPTQGYRTSFQAQGDTA